MTPRIVGLDLSLTAAGVATHTGPLAMKPPKNCVGVHRLAWYRSVLGDIYNDADLVVVEEYAFSRANAHSHEIGELGGVIRLDLHDSGIPFVAVNPSCLKKFATGKGNAGKDDMVATAARNGCPVNDNNAVDAWWLRQMALYAYGDADIPGTAYRAAAATIPPWPNLEGKAA